MKIPTLILRQPGQRTKSRPAFFLMACALVGLVALILPPCFRAQGAPSARPAQKRHVLVISVDGLGASLYDRLAAKIHISNLPRLRREGSYAEGVVGVYPTLTYPSHTTIVTGRM
ncbi:MAG: alkaline phosphatase family protein, partial [Terriglobia bacterium]